MKKIQLRGVDWMLKRIAKKEDMKDSQGYELQLPY